MQGEYICNPDPEGFSVCGGEQGPGAECQGESQGHGITSQGNYLRYILSFYANLLTFFQDDERLKNERVRALKAKERFAQSTAGKHNFPFMTDLFFVAKYKTQGNYRFPLPHDHSKLTVVIVQSHTFPFKILLNFDMYFFVLIFVTS